MMNETWVAEEAPGNLMITENSDPRRLFMVLSPSSLPYARLALESLYANCAEGFSLALVTDGREDVLTLEEELGGLKKMGEHPKRVSAVYGEADLADLEQDKFGRYDHLRYLRHGHPCWRKITDPVLLSDDRDEMIVLDPDLYFPNRFCFEETLESGVMLMWQHPSCLLPEEVVEAAINEKIALAHHTDIGVAQWRAALDLEWLNWLVQKLGSPELPRHMHVESIVWAALAMKMGGGYLDPRRWVCWHRSQYKRILLKLGTPGSSILNRESFSGIKCFHAGGVAKWWLADAHGLGILAQNEDVTANSVPKPYEELAPSQYHRLQRNRRWLQKLGYHAIFGNG
jgi:hypothetical protein